MEVFSLLCILKMFQLQKLHNPDEKKKHWHHHQRRSGGLSVKTGQDLQSILDVYLEFVKCLCCAYKNFTHVHSVKSRQEYLLWVIIAFIASP
jgi:hypothetical protein